MLAPEASIAMMAAGVNHLPVLDDDGEVVGILSASNLMTLEARSPFALRRAIMAARNEEELIAAAADIPKLFLDLMTAHLDAPSVTRVLTVLHDSHDGAPARARRSTASASRRCPSPGSPSAAPRAASSRWPRTRTTGSPTTTPTTRAVDDYFRVLARDVNAGLARCGLPADPHGVLRAQPRSGA